MKVEKNFSLKSFNTFGVECIAQKLIRVEAPEELIRLHEDRSLAVPGQLILGGGSNILFTRPAIPQVVLIEIPGIRIAESNSDFAILTAGAGEIWDNLVKFALKNGLSGLENLSIIPGKAGAAPIQNIGAYGVELSEVFESLNAFDLNTGEMKEFKAADCQFGYRNSLFKTTGKGRYIICEISLKLGKESKVNVSYGSLSEVFRDLTSKDITSESVREAVISIRNSKLPNPAVIGNAGSFFKNPVVDSATFEIIKERYPNLPAYKVDKDQIKVPAGWLIEKCGWKGKKAGNAGIHEKQALVLVNNGGATGKEIFDLAMQVQSSVLTEFGVILEPEVNII